MNKRPFIPLHLHSEFSISDGLCRIKPLMNALREKAIPAVAITDICNFFSLVKFYRAANAQGIKAIFGTELYVSSKNTPTPQRVVLLSQNENGLKNLRCLVSKTYLEGQREPVPLTQVEWLSEYGEDNIALVISREGPLGQALLQNEQAKAEKIAKWWMSQFDNRCYFGITRCGFEHESRINEHLIRLAINNELLLVASNEIMFLNKGDFEAHEARVCIQEGTTLNQENRVRKYTQEQYLKSSHEMCQLFEDIPAAIENGVELAKRCNVTLDLGQVYLPDFPVPKGLSIEEYLAEKSKQGLEKRFEAWEKHGKIEPEKKALYPLRLQDELEVINKMGFAGYFLIVADFIQWAKNNDIPVGPGRGSGAGSLVAYVLEITDLDPIRYELLFERFLNPERVSMPDFDVDFCMDYRDRVIEYVTHHYGRANVSQISTFGTMAAKAVVRDVGRVLGHPYGFVDKIAKLIPFEIGMTLDKALQEEALKERYDKEEEVQGLINLAQKLEGLTRNVGKHAGGVVIAPSSLTDYTALYCEQGSAQTVTQLDKDDVEAVGLVKFDFLGLRTLTIINWAVQNVNQHNDKEAVPLKISDIRLNDSATFKLLKACKTTAVFQLESRGMKDLIHRLQPDTFEEIVALVALFRPGPLQSGMVDDFINRKHGRAKVEYPHDKIAPILKPTYGVILYQEQVMQIAQVLAGYTLGGADLLRRAMGKKKPEEMAKQREIFISGATENKVDPDLAAYIFDLMEKFAGYGFNRSHSAAYALVSYQTAWLKAHYPAAFMAAVLSSDMNHTDKVVVFIEDCQSMGLNVIAPCVNQSFFRFTQKSETDIIYGLGAIKGVGEGAIDTIVQARQDKGAFTDLNDFCIKVDLRKVNRRVLEALIKSGAMDGFSKERAQLIASIEDVMQLAEKHIKDKRHGQGDLFAQDPVTHTFSTAQVTPWDELTRLQGEKETLGHYFSGHPFFSYHNEVSKIVDFPLNALVPKPKHTHLIAGLIVGIRSMLTKKGDRMGFVTLDDATAKVEVAVFSDLFNAKRTIVTKDEILVVDGQISLDPTSQSIRIRAKQILSLDEARVMYAKKLRICLTQKNANIPHKIHSLEGILAQHPKGDCPVYLEYRHPMGQAQLKLDASWNVLPTQTLQSDLQHTLEEDVAFDYTN